MKNFIKRSLYLIYYLKELKSKQFWSFIKYASISSGKSKFRLITEAIISVYKYNISLKDYFYFRFFELNKDEKAKWAGSGYMYEYQLKMNPKGVRHLLENKNHFLKHYKDFVKRDHKSLEELKESSQLAESLLQNPSAKLVLKGIFGQVGKEVEIINCADFDAAKLIDYMDKNNLGLAEEYVLQHPSIMSLSPSGLNTVRIFTQIEKDQVNFLGARLRVSVNSPVDNMGAGNLAAPVDIKTGIVNGPGVYSDITKKDEAIHPLTGKEITGFAIPHWDKVLELAKNAALFSRENRSVGWDIAITTNGPEIIEGNHNWCKLLWQLPVKQGLKSEIESYL